MKITAEAALGLAWVLDRMGNDVFLDAKPQSPWLAVDFPTRPEQFAVWLGTGAVYRVGADGAVDEDPIYTPGDFARLQAPERLLRLLDRTTEEKDKLESLVRQTVGDAHAILSWPQQLDPLRNWVKDNPVTEDDRPKP